MSDYSEAYDYLERQAARQPFCADEAAHISAHHDDALTFLRTLPDASVHAVITDPPYGLADHKPKQVIDALTAWANGDRERVPTGKGFMGRDWDAFVPPPAVWDECLRVLKPGGHLAVFAGSRTVDLMGLSIRLAGFEMRDGIAAWVYGSGFPKSLNVATAVDKVRDEDKAPRAALCAWLADRADEAGVTRRQVDEALGTSDMGGWWLSRLPHRCAVPTIEQWEQLRALLGFGSEMDAEVWRLNGRKGTPGEAWTSADVLATEARMNEPSGIVGVGQGDRTAVVREIKAANSDGSREWQGWGTALKPAHEPILLARKPLASTVAANVLAHGAGGINIDACRVGDEVLAQHGRGNSQSGSMSGGNYAEDDGRNGKGGRTWSGRWPTNVVLAHHPDCGPDGAPGPCVDGCQVAALDTQSEGTRAAKPSVRIEKPAEATPNAKTWEGGPLNGARPARGFTDDQGGASRFFPTFRYQAKAPKAERPIVDGTGHPTVKPLGLMRWLVRLLVPEGGTVLDPFAGSGATLEAARLEGVRATGVERDEHSCKLIAERLGVTTLEPIVGVADPADELLSRVHAAGSVDELMELYRQAVAEQLWCDEIKMVFTARKMAVAS